MNCSKPRYKAVLQKNMNEFRERGKKRLRVVVSSTERFVYDEAAFQMYGKEFRGTKEKRQGVVLRST